ncbi:hypothetical protein HYV85_01045 [Candidatus Woesearchaeota archaeon]|nr:hypothetical protein [Candidatus Woesearchaeota archaeon]
MEKTVAILGPMLTYTHAAAMEHYDESARIIPLGSIDAVIAAVEKEDVDEGVVPEENRVKHEIEETYAGLYKRAVTVVGKVVLPIKNCIGVSNSSANLERITEIWTKADAYAQCGDWLGKHTPNARLVPWNSTASAIEGLSAKKLPHVAAIGPQVAIEHYGLHLAAQGIDDVNDNATLFSVIGRGREIGMPQANEEYETWLLMRPAGDAPGELYRLLRPISEHGVDMTKICSLPQDRLMRAGKPLLDLPGGYLFEVRVKGHILDSKVGAMLGDLRKACETEKTELVVAGSYKMVRLADYRT